MRTGTENQIELFLISHGSTRMNEEGRYLGKTNESLSENGLAVVKEKAGNDSFLRKDQINYVFSGPMNRVKETAEEFFPGHQIVEIPELTEIDFGDFEGKNYKELSGNPDYQKWIDSGGTIAFPNGETREDFISRSKEGFLHIVDHILAEGRDNVKAACFMHGGNIMGIMYSLLGGEYFDYQVKPAEGYHIVVETTPEIKIIKTEEMK